MMRTNAENKKIQILALAAAVFLIYYFVNPDPQNFYDYNFRVADNVLRGDIGFTEKPPSWLNEFVPFEGKWYSVFPLGSVLTMMPFALLKIFGFIENMPAAFISALTASLICWFLLLIAHNYDLSREKRLLISLGILFGTWMFTNLAIAGAWQLALGFAVLGEFGAIYFSVYNKKPFWAGAFFAIAFGNRTEILLTAPIFFLLLLHERKLDIFDKERESINSDESGERKNFRSLISYLRAEIFHDPQKTIRALAAFCIVPAMLGFLTLIYNYVRFHSFTDFGYARIPGVLREPWYNHGIFSVYYIPRQAFEMLLKPWETRDSFPYLAPNPFSSSILWSSPFLLLTFRFGAKDKIMKYLSWAAIVILTILLWMHGNSGGWQFGYRYAMMLLPWIFLVLLENSRKRVSIFEWFIYCFSFIINGFAAYIFFWTDYLKP